MTRGRLLPRISAAVFAAALMLGAALTVPTAGAARAHSASKGHYHYSYVGPGPPPSGLPQSRCASMALKRHKVHVGERITGLAGPAHCSGASWTWVTPPSWSGSKPPPLKDYTLHIYDLQGNPGYDNALTPIRHCGNSASTCLVKAANITVYDTYKGTWPNVWVTVHYTWVMACIKGGSDVGSWESCDYFAVVKHKKRH